jgi:hypothetical protein
MKEKQEERFSEFTSNTQEKKKKPIDKRKEQTI